MEEQQVEIFVLFPGIGRERKVYPTREAGPANTDKILEEASVTGVRCEIGLAYRIRPTDEGDDWYEDIPIQPYEDVYTRIAKAVAEHAHSSDEGTIIVAIV